MQFKTLNDNLVAYRYRKGAGPVVVFANALGSDQSIWDNVIETMGRHRATLTYDLRGQGASGITTDPYTMDQLGDDLIAVLDHLGLTLIHTILELTSPRTEELTLIRQTIAHIVNVSGGDIPNCSCHRT